MGKNDGAVYFALSLVTTDITLYTLLEATVTASVLVGQAFCGSALCTIYSAVRSFLIDSKCLMQCVNGIEVAATPRARQDAPLRARMRPFAVPRRCRAASTATAYQRHA